MANRRRAVPWLLAAVLVVPGCGKTITVTVGDPDATQSQQQPESSAPSSAPPTSSAPARPETSKDSTFVHGVKVTPETSGAVVVQLVSGKARLVACVSGKDGEERGSQALMGGLNYRGAQSDAKLYLGQPLEPTKSQEFAGPGGRTVSCLARDVNFGEAAAEINLYVVGLTPPGSTQVPSLKTLEHGAPVAVPNTPAAAINNVAVADHEIQKMCGMLSKWASIAAGETVRVSLPPCDVDQVVPSDPLPTSPAPTPAGQHVSASGRKTQASETSPVNQRRLARVGSSGIAT